MISFDNSWGPVIARKAGAYFNPECDKVVCRVKGTKLLGGSVFSSYTGESISIHAAAWMPNWLTRELLFVTFGYPFLQLPCNRVFSQISVANEESLKFNLHLGFKEVARIGKVFRGGVDCIVTCLEKDECRWLTLPKPYSENKLQAVGG